MVRVLLVHNRYRQRAGEDRSFQGERDLLSADDRVALTEHVVDSREIDDYGALQKAALPFRMSWSRRSAAILDGMLRDSPADVVHFHNTFPLISPAAYGVCRDRGALVVQTVRNFRQFCANGLFFRDGHVCEDCVGRVPQWPGIVHRCYHSSAAQSAAVVAMQTVHSVRGTWRKDVDAYVVATRFMKDKLGSLGLDRERIVVKPNVVEIAGVPGGGPRSHAAYVGRLTHEKGVFTMLRAWRSLREIPLVVAGGGEELERLRIETDRTGLADRVTFLGETSHEQALEVIRTARFVVMPSLSYETFGRIPVEAYACGSPVLASRIGALAETVVDGETGLLFTPGDEHELAAAARRLWEGDTAALTRRARAHYETVYAPEVVHEQLVAFYEELVRR
ncbi:MAG: glycosyltransferase [Actinomycetota bacterium]|nr:glycosyltransferase [Actinomycetota bacterium]